MKVHKYFIGIGFALLVSAAGPTAAQTKDKAASSSPGLGIATVNNEIVGREALVFKDVRQQLAKYQSTYQADIKKEEDVLRDADKELARKRALLSSEAFNEERQRFQERIGGLQNLVQRSKQAMARVRNRAIVKVEKAVNNIIRDVAKDFQLAVIFRKNHLVYGHKSLDITQEVLTRLDKQLPKLKVDDPRKPIVSKPGK